MPLAPFFSRVADAVAGVTAVTAGELEDLLAQTVVAVTFNDRAALDGGLRHGSELLVNLLARLYPTLELIVPADEEGPDSAVRQLARSCGDSARLINPDIDIHLLTTPSSGALVVSFGDVAAPDADIVADAQGWTACVGRGTNAVSAAREADSIVDLARRSPAAPMAAMVAGCLTAGEVFRVVFADHLGSTVPETPEGEAPIAVGRSLRKWPLTTANVPADGLAGVTVAHMWLAGAGAIGQAAVAALAASGAAGTLTVVDPELVELSNLQRYVLSAARDVGRPKTQLVTDALVSCRWSVNEAVTRWGADERSAPGRDVVLVALDSARDRLGVAAGMHRAVYNAWTQPADLGWSRHEQFGVEPCLACLYYPDRVRPSHDELVATALGQPRLRVLSYMTTSTPVGHALPEVAAILDMPAPPEAEEWLARPLLADLIAQGLVTPADAARWAPQSVDSLYVDGVCGGGLLNSASAAGTVDAEVTVPLAHQSALAGVLLAFEALAAFHPQLRDARPTAIESRFDVLRGLPQVLQRPRQRTPGCICGDPDYAAVADPG